MIIKVDVREHDLMQAINALMGTVSSFQELIIVHEQLPLGDVIICDGEEEKVIIERKTLKDLSASIKDGRYEEQSYRLNGIDHPNHNIMYLIEGSFDRLNSFKGRDDKTTLYSAMVSLNYFKGFSVMRSLGVEESAMIICNCALKVMKSEQQGKTMYYKKTLKESKEGKEVGEVKEEIGEVNEVKEETGVIEPTGISYCSVVKKVKKENVTSENIGEIMLCQIPGISSVTAIAIMDQFKTIPNLIMMLKQDPSCIQNISYKTGAGQTRKINKNCVTSILLYLTQQT